MRTFTVNCKNSAYHRLTGRVVEHNGVAKSTLVEFTDQELRKSSKPEQASRGGNKIWFRDEEAARD